MAIVSAAQFPGLVPDLTQLGLGVQRGQQIGQARQQAQATQVALESKEEEDRLRSITMAALELKPMLENNDVTGTLNAAKKRLADLQAKGINSDDTQDFITTLTTQGPQAALQMLNTTIAVGERFGVIGKDTAMADVSSLQAQLTAAEKLKLEREKFEQGEFVPVIDETGKAVMMRESEAAEKGLEHAQSSLRGAEKEARLLSIQAQTQQTELENLKRRDDLNKQAKESAENQLKANRKRFKERAEVKESIEDAKIAIERVSGTSTGIPGQLTQWIWGSPSADLEAAIESFESRLRFDQIQAMKQESATGATGLGQVAIPEFNALGRKLQTLKQSQSEQSLRKNFTDFINHLERIEGMINSDELIDEMLNDQLISHIDAGGKPGSFKFDMDQLFIKNHPDYGDMTIKDAYKKSIELNTSMQNLVPLSREEQEELDRLRGIK